MRSLIIILLLALLGWAAFTHGIKNDLNQRRKEIVQQCVQAMPMLEQRYKNLPILLELYDPPAQSEQYDTKSEDHSHLPPEAIIRLNGTNFFLESIQARNAKFSLEIIDGSRTVRTYAIRVNGPSEEARRRAGIPITTYEKIMQAKQLESTLESFFIIIREATITTDQAELAKLKANLAATDKDLIALFEQLGQKVSAYNATIHNSFIGKIAGGPFIGESDPVMYQDQDYSNRY